MKIEGAILAECKKLISRHGAALALASLYKKRFRNATGREPCKHVRTPPQWRVSSTFDPFYVRGRAPTIAKAITQSIESGTYDPLPAIVHRLRKPDGGYRHISIFPVADAGVANEVFRRVLSRNQSRLSPHSYAYRRDIRVHDAVERLSRTVERASRLYMVEFDFSKYFDTIDHDYVTGALDKYFKVTKAERQIIAAFLGSRRAHGDDAFARREFSRCTRGIPQGNSISLFLANVACHELDLELARAGHTFARYADDIVLACNSDKQASEALHQILQHCAGAGLAVNFRKSDGISEFSPQSLAASADGSGTIKQQFEYLGHAYSFQLVNRRNNPAPQLVRRLGVKGRSVRRMKEKLSNVIHSHLLRYVEGGLFTVNRINAADGVDWDVVTCINDLRRYIYGGVREDAIRRALGDRTERLHRSTGVMSFFPLVNDVVQLKAIDGWLVHAVAAAIARREAVLRGPRFGVTAYPNLQASDLLQGTWYDRARASSGIDNDVTFPSLVRAWKYARRGLRAFNLQQFPFHDPHLY